jgi:hypothetical protein
MDDLEFRDAVRSILIEARRVSLKETEDLLSGRSPILNDTISEYGDEFGDVDLGGWSDLVKVLGSPQTVLRTVMGTVANISSKARALLATTIRGLPGLVIPFVQARYKAIFDEEKRRRQEIERMYPEIFAIAHQAFPDDAKLFAFMVNPVLATTAAVGSLGSDLALDLVDALSGQSPDVITRTRPLRRRVVMTRGESVQRLSLREAMGDDSVVGLLRDRTFQRTLANAKPVRDIMEASRDMKNTSLNQIINVGRAVSSARSIEDLEKMGLNLNADELEHAEIFDEVLSAAKVYVLDALVERVKIQIQELRNENVPEGSEMYKIYGEVLKRLDSLRSDKAAPSASSVNNAAQ